MKKLALLALAILVSSPAMAGDKYLIDKTHANIVWSANHMGFSNPSGSFSDVTGTIFFDEAKPEISMVDVVVNTASIFTLDQKFTDHLKGADFFKTDMFPDATFKSTSVKVTGKDTAIISGNLKLLGSVQPIKIKAKFNKSGKNPFNQKRTIGFSGETVIKRSDFGMKYGIPNVSDEVKLAIEVEAIHEADQMGN